MAVLNWDAAGERFFETGVDKGVLYVQDGNGDYPLGVAWNGLVSIKEQPSGAESNKKYADNILYLNLRSAEEFALGIEAFTYPDEFAECDGSASGATGVSLGQQSRSVFGLAYRTKLGNDTDGEDHGYKIHVVYGLTASPTERANTTVNESPEAVMMNWTAESVPAAAAGFKPVSHITIDSTTIGATELAAVEDALFGTAIADPFLPLPDALITLATP